MSTVPLQWKEVSIHPIPKTTAPKQEAYLHPIYITTILERKYNGNEMDVARFISFRFKFFHFRFVSVNYTACITHLINSTMHFSLFFYSKLHLKIQ